MCVEMMEANGDGGYSGDGGSWWRCVLRWWKLMEVWAETIEADGDSGDGEACDFAECLCRGSIALYVTRCDHLEIPRAGPSCHKAVMSK